MAYLHFTDSDPNLDVHIRPQFGYNNEYGSKSG